MVTRADWLVMRATAGYRGAEALAQFTASCAETTRAGIERGGPSCCGTTGIWHHPWCPVGPWEPDPLLDPDCRDGKHSSCVGGPCECPHHRTAAVI